MSTRMAIALVAGLCAAIGLGSGASAEMAPTKVTKPKTVTITGCPTRGFPDTCTMMRGPKDANYNVSSANPPAPIGKMIRLKGTITDKRSFCGGLVLDNIKWMAIKGKCPAPKGAK